MDRGILFYPALSTQPILSRGSYPSITHFTSFLCKFPQHPQPASLRNKLVNKTAYRRSTVSPSAVSHMHENLIKFAFIFYRGCTALLAFLILRIMPYFTANISTTIAFVTRLLSDSRTTFKCLQPRGNLWSKMQLHMTTYGLYTENCY